MPHPRVPPPPPCPAWLVEEFGAGSGRGGSALPTQPNQSKSHQAEDEQMEEKTPIPPTLSPTHQGISRFNCYDPLNGIVFSGPACGARFTVSHFVKPPDKSNLAQPPATRDSLYIQKR